MDHRFTYIYVSVRLALHVLTISNHNLLLKTSRQQSSVKGLLQLKALDERKVKENIVKNDRRSNDATEDMTLDRAK